MRYLLIVLAHSARPGAGPGATMTVLGLLFAVAATSVPMRPAVHPVPLSSVRLRRPPDSGDAPNARIFARQQHNLDYLVQLDPGRLACPFLHNAANNNSHPSNNTCVDYSENKGHWFQGHYLSATAHMAVATANATVASRAAQLLGWLQRCQRDDGYLGAWPSGVFDDLEAGRKLRNGVSVPYYDVHKMFAGLLDQYTLLHDARALRIAEKMADYFLRRIRRLLRVNGTAVWQRVLCVEWGGMNEAAYNLYGITGNESHRELGDHFEKQTFSLPLASGVDALAGLHANTHIPQVIGMARGFELTANATQRAMAEFFFETVFHTVP
jgi:DUF1680 family protein